MSDLTEITTVDIRRFARVARLAKAQSDLLESLYLQLGKKNMHLYHRLVEAEQALTGNDIEAINHALALPPAGEGT